MAAQAWHISLASQSAQGAGNRTPAAYAFTCSDLVEITIPDTVSVIERAAFSSALMLERATLPRGLKEISPSTFYGCKKLKEVYIPRTVKIIGAGAFEDCNSLEVIRYGGSEADFKRITLAGKNERFSAARVYFNA